jgi:hypothetical protein
MDKMKTWTLLSAAWMVALEAIAQTPGILQGVEADVQLSTTQTDGDNAPFWLSSNRYGVESVEPNSGYMRAALRRALANDSDRVWRWGYELDVVAATHNTSDFFVQQAYVALNYKAATLTVGSREQEPLLRTKELTTGNLCMGVNARPIPQVRLDVDYFSFPGTKGWWKWKFTLSGGVFTDGNWQESNITNHAGYAKKVLYHEKQLFWKFGKEDKFPLTLEAGAQIGQQFGGKLYNMYATRWGDDNANGNIVYLPSYTPSTGLKNLVDVLFMSGSDMTDGGYKNTLGNVLGSTNFRLQYHGKNLKVGLYGERFFEDHSMLFIQYGIYDHLGGLDIELPRFKYLNHIVYEHITTKDQSGPVYHDKSSNMPQGIYGKDNYYNHGSYPGWQHWGMSIGNPLITSPIYNTNGNLKFMNNRINACHIGISGDPVRNLHYRMLYTYSENWGTYATPFEEVKYQHSWMGEVRYTVPRYRMDWLCAVGYDYGGIYGRSLGVQLSVTKHFTVTPSKNSKR